MEKLKICEKFLYLKQKLSLFCSCTLLLSVTLTIFFFVNQPFRVLLRFEFLHQNLYNANNASNFILSRLSFRNFPPFFPQQNFTLKIMNSTFSHNMLSEKINYCLLVRAQSGIWKINVRKFLLYKMDIQTRIKV